MPDGTAVIIPTKHRSALLARSLDAVVAAAGSVDEPVSIIVVDDGDDRATAAVVEVFAQAAPVPIRLIRGREYSGQGPGDARNAGVAHAQGDLLAFTDDDTCCRTDWLVRGIARLRAEPTLAGVEGAVLPAVGDEVDPLRARVVQNRVGGSFLTANLFLRREAVRRAGGFQRLWPGGWAPPFREDTDLALRVRARVGPIAFDPGLVVVHPIEQVPLRAHLRTARFFLLDAPFARLHPGAIPGVVEAPAARLRIRAACAAVAALPLLIPGSTRGAATAVVLVASAAQDLQLERDLRAAGERRRASRIALDVLRRAPRNVAWTLTAGVSRLLGGIGVRIGAIPVRADPPPLTGDEDSVASATRAARADSRGSSTGPGA